MTHDPDDLLPLLAPRPEPPPDSTALFAATAGLLRRRARFRRVVKVVGVLAVFGLGGAAGWFLKPTPAPEVVRVVETVPVAVVVPLPPPDPAPAGRPSSPAALELLAEQADSSAEAAALYRAAGDKYLADASDYEQALRCYRLYFRHAGPTGAAVATDDSWLLTSLKNSKLKEKPDANRGS